MDEFLTVPSAELGDSLDERLTPEPPPSIRTEAQRDRDRILYSSALLRLGHITQVATPEAGHIFHSRLTHTIKVAQVARGLAQRFKVLATRGELDAPTTALVHWLDEDATEAAALAHDLGHPPFGHLAEKVLQGESKFATFEGNPQSFRIVTRLALRSVAPGGPLGGLNLTRRTLNGILKYPWFRGEDPPKRLEKWGAYDDGDRNAFIWTRQGYPDGERTLEACLMDWADDVTYAVHDMDDFYRANLIPLERLTHADDEERERFNEHLRETFSDSGDEGLAERLTETAAAMFTGDFVSAIRSPFRGRFDERVNLRELGSTLIGRYIAAPSLEDAGDGERVKLAIDDGLIRQVTVLKQLTWFYVINRPSLSIIQQGQTQVVRSLYEMYRQALADGDLHLLPPLFAERVDPKKGKTHEERVVIDLIAGMTETRAAEIYRQKTGITSGSVLMPSPGGV